MNCKDCAHYDVCDRIEKQIVFANSSFEEVINSLIKRCRHFKNKADFVEVKHGEIKYINRPTPAKFAYVKGEDGQMHYGKLFDKMDYNPVAYCSLCSKRLADSFQNYCPYCGAKLEGFKPTPQFEEDIKNIIKGGDENA